MKTKVLILAATLAANAFAESSTAGFFQASERTIEHACLRGDVTAFAEAVKPLDEGLARTPGDPALLYTRGYAFYASSALLRRTNDRAALQQCFESAEGLLERVHGAPWEAEADALRANILGSLIGLQRDPALAGATLGAKSGRLLAKAAREAPGSPRVLLFRGTSLLFTPEAFGGNPAEGAKLIQQAADRFAADDASAPGPHWGRADALTWLGIAKQKAGDAAGARAAWEQALALEPKYAWVKFALLPSLDQKQTTR